MLDHPLITDPDFTTAVLSWWDGGLHFFTAPPCTDEGFVILDVFYAAYLITFLVALWLMFVWQRRGSLRIERAQCVDTVLVAVAGGAFGGRLGEAIFYNSDYFIFEPLRLVLNDPSVLLTATPWRLFTNGSGQTIHGVMAGAVIALWFWARRIRKPFLHLLDQGTIIVAFGTILGRTANFLAGELWGRASDLPWAMRFPLRGQLFRQVFANVNGDTFVLVKDTATAGAGPGHLEPAVVDQGFEVLKNHPASLMTVGSDKHAMLQMVWECVTTPRHPSQLYQALADGLALLIILAIIRSRAKTVGILTASFLILYGLIRALMEQFRQPEPGLGFVFGLLTRGQLLSLSMVAAGMITAAIVWKRPVRIESLEQTHLQPTQAA